MGVAEAYIFERADRISKTHKGVQIELFRLTKQDNRVDQALRLFRSHSYEFKSSADYFTGPDAFTACTRCNRRRRNGQSFCDAFRGTCLVCLRSR
jgi:hypothetical protein